MARLVTRGCTGLDVKELQAALNFHVRSPATPLATDGIFGPLTDARVREFQKLSGITADGDVGPITIGALYRTLLVPIEADIVPRQPVGGRQGFAPAGPGRPEGPEPPPRVPFPPRVPPAPQSRMAASEGFELESKLTFNPLAKSGDSRFKLSFNLSLPWPAFLPKPLKLELEGSPPGIGKFEMDAKLKLPLEYQVNRRITLTPYFFAGAGVSQDHFKDLNLGAGAALKLKLLETRGGWTLGVEADGGMKFQFDPHAGKAEAKGFLDLMFMAGVRF